MKTTIRTLAVVLSLAGAGALALPASAQTASGKKAMSDADITRMLESKGYSDVRITDHEKSHVDVTAMKGGKSVRLAVDSATGHIKPDTDKDKDKASPY
jgi:hypothetical protein